MARRASSRELSLEPVNWLQFAPNAFTPVIGVDEVGRGCLAGPVYAGAVHLRDNSLSHLLTDSKLLSEKRREELSALVRASHDFALGFATPEEIDRINILQASLLAMHRAVEELMQNLKVSSAVLLIDGTFKIASLKKLEQHTFVKGDLRVAPISAAAIVAKVARDHLMNDLGEKFPQYGFEKHKGYSTAVHKSAIAEFGPCDEHRKSFAGVKEFVARPSL